MGKSYGEQLNLLPAYEDVPRACEVALMYVLRMLHSPGQVHEQEVRSDSFDRSCTRVAVHLDWAFVRFRVLRDSAERPGTGLASMVRPGT